MCDRETTREAAIAYLVKSTPANMIDMLPKVVSANLPVLMGRSCAHFVCETGHAHWRVCPQCGAEYGSGVPSCVVTHG